MTKVISPDQKKSWNKSLIENNNSFLQSFEWGKFQKSLQRKVFFLESDDWKSLVIKHHLPFNKSYLYCPYGPIISPEAEKEKKIEKFIPLEIIPHRSAAWITAWGNSRGDLNTPREFLTGFIENLKKLNPHTFLRGIREGVGINRDSVIFIRIEPEWKIENEEERELWEKRFREFGFKKISKDVQPSKTLILDLGLSEEEILAKMHPKWRYNIRLAQKKAVKVEKYHSPIIFSQLEIFYDLLKKTSRRHHYKIFGKEYYKKELALKTQDFSAELFFAYYQKQVVAANLVIFFGKRATYVHGGSSQKHKEAMASHFLQWEQIKEAKRRGCNEYDFWGIDEKKWPGFTRFKKGFGGQEINYLGAYDYVISPFWYQMYNLTKRIRKILLNFKTIEVGLP